MNAGGIDEKYPVEIWNTDKFNQQTWSFWYKPTGTPEDGDVIISRDHEQWWGLRAGASAWDSNEMDLKYSVVNSDRSDMTNETINNLHTGWLDPPGSNKPLKRNTWHYFAISINYEGNTQQLWIHREGDGLIFYVSHNLPAGLSAGDGSHSGSQSRAVKLGEKTTSKAGQTSVDNRIPGDFD